MYVCMKYIATHSVIMLLRESWFKCVLCQHDSKVTNISNNNWIKQHMKLFLLRWYCFQWYHFTKRNNVSIKLSECFFVLTNRVWNLQLVPLELKFDTQSLSDVAMAVCFHVYINEPVDYVWQTSIKKYFPLNFNVFWKASFVASRIVQKLL